MSLLSYPHYQVNVEDRSIFTPVVLDQLPLHRPIYVMKTQRGPIDTPVWCPTIETARRVFGAETFNSLNKDYFSQSSLFLTTTFPENGAFIVRVTNTAAKASHTIFEVGVTEDPAAGSVKLRWYKRTALINGTVGSPVTRLNADGVTTTSVTTDDETFDALKARVISGTLNEVIYPIFYIKASSTGAWGDDIGFKFFYDAKQNSEDLAARAAKSLTFSMAPIQRDYKASSVNSMRTIYGDTFSSFVLKPDVTDAVLARKVSMGDVVAALYNGTSAIPVTTTVYAENIEAVGTKCANAEALVDAPASVIAAATAAALAATNGYTDDAAADYIIAQAVAAGANAEVISNYMTTYLQANTSPSSTDAEISAARKAGAIAATGGSGSSFFKNGSTVNSWLINIFSGLDINNTAYNKVSVAKPADAAGASGLPIVSMNSTTIHYLTGGLDAPAAQMDCDNWVESKVVSFLKGTLNPAIYDKARYPVTHVIDIGWSMATKNAICDFVAVRDDVIVILSTQQVTNTKIDATGNIVTTAGEKTTIAMNNAASDQSIGRALRSRVILTPESIVKGTTAFRGEIYMHAGPTVESSPFKFSSMTLWRAKTLAHAHKRDFLGEAPEGLPFSAVEMFQEFNWVPSTEEIKNLSWSAGCNYVQYYSMTGLHVATVRTVYAYETSVLLGAEFAAAVVYTKHEARQVWATHAGKVMPAEALHDTIKKDVESRMIRLLNNRFKFNVKVYQTKEEQDLGYQHHIQIEIIAGGQFRVGMFDIICKRENFNG